MKVSHVKHGMITAFQWKCSDDEVLKKVTVAVILRKSEYLEIWPFLFLHYKTSIYSQNFDEKFNSVIKFSAFGSWKNVEKISLIHLKSNIRLKGFKTATTLDKENTIKTDKHATNISSATRHRQTKTTKWNYNTAIPQRAETLVVMMYTQKRNNWKQIFESHRTVRDLKLNISTTPKEKVSTARPSNSCS